MSTLYLRLDIHICLPVGFEEFIVIIFRPLCACKDMVELYGDKVKGKDTTLAPLPSFSSWSSLSFMLYHILHLDISLFLPR